MYFTKSKFTYLTTLVILTSCQFGLIEKNESIKLIPFGKDNIYQYNDPNGQTKINPQYSIATVFREGLALVRTEGEEGLWGFINESGTFVIPPIYSSATTFSEGIAWVVEENEAPKAINKNGNVLFTLHQAEKVMIYKNGLAAFKIKDLNDGKWGFINTAGQIIINPQFSAVGYFSSNKCPVKNDKDEWGYIDEQGKIVINYQFEQAESFSGEKAVVYSGKNAGLIDMQGKYIVNPQYEFLYIDGNINMFKQDDKYGWCDDNGKIVINQQFNNACPFNDSKVAPVLSGKKWGYIDKDGVFKISPQFDLSLSFIGDYSMVILDNKAGTINLDGKYTINPQYSSISPDFIQLTFRNYLKIYYEVKTDYFDLLPVLNHINFESPEQLSLTNSTISDLLAQFEINEAFEQQQFIRYTDEFEIYQDLDITEDIYVSLNIKSEAFELDTVGWYNEYTYNPNAAINAFEYTIKLRNEGFGKGHLIVDELEKELDNYSLDDTSTDHQRFYEKDGQVVIISISENKSIIKITIATMNYD